MKPMILKNIIIGVLAIIGFSIAALIEFPRDPARPYLAVFGILMVANINLQYLFGLNMGITFPVAMQGEHKRRKGVLVASWFILVFMIYGFFTW
jgi:hypothetical protein